MNFRTDLALERRELLTDREIPGVKSRVNQSGSVCVTAIEVQTEQGAQAIGKPVGSYITVEVPPFSADAELLDGRLTTVADELRALLPEEGLVLVVGIGNDHITPDALGPLAGERILATRHIGPELARSIGMEHLRPVAGLLPGVLGQTGIETGEIIAGVARAVRPAAVITVDALAARRLSRLGCTIQMSNTGITPGSGVGNARTALNQETVGVPVIAIGVPTVVDAATLAIDLLGEGKAEKEEQRLRELMEPRGTAMMVTPREIDLLVERAARLVALSINCALQPTLSAEDLLSITS